MKNRKNLLLITVSVLVVVFVAVASYFMATKDQDPSTTKAPEPQPAKVSEHGFPISALKAGEGGSGTAADGTTPIGYSPSCDDAVRAAVNYVSADSYSFETSRKNKETLKQILLPNKASTDYIEAIDWATTERIVSHTSLLKPQIYNTVTCESGKTAHIAVASRIQTNAHSLDGKDIPESTEIRVADQHLVWNNGDWKLDMGAQYTRTESQLLYTNDKPEPSSTAQVLNDLFTDSDGNPLSRDGWMELSK